MAPSSPPPPPPPSPASPTNGSTESNKSAALKILKDLRNHEPAADARLDVINAFLLSIKRAADLANLEPKDPSLPPSTNAKIINIFPKELQYLNATKAETHLRRVQAARNQDPEAEQFTNAELDVEVQERGKLGEFMHDTFRRRKGNVNLAVIMGLAPWTNFAAADQAGRTEGTRSAEERRRLWEEPETPGNVIVVKWEDNVVGPPSPLPYPTDRQHILTVGVDDHIRPLVVHQQAHLLPRWKSPPPA